MTVAVNLAQIRRRALARASSRVRVVDALCAALMLVKADVWRQLGGFDERFVLYGEDVGPCRRARRLGYTPLQVTGARYLHVGGASSSPGERLRLILTGQATLYQMYLRPWRTEVAVAALTIGHGDAGKRRSGHRTGRFRHWRHVWRERSRWRRGWPDRE